MTDDSIRVKVDVLEDCGHERWILVDEKGYIIAFLDSEAVNVHDLHLYDTFEMKLIAP